MINSIKGSPIVRKAAVGAMMMGAVIAGAPQAKSAPKPEANAQQEVVMGKNAVNALAAIVLSTTSSNVRNLKLEQKLYNTIKDPAEKAAKKENINNLHNYNGSYLTAAIVQSDLNTFGIKKYIEESYGFEKTLVSDHKGKLKEDCIKMYNDYAEGFNNSKLGLFAKIITDTKGKASAEDCNREIDRFKDVLGFTEEEDKEYKESVDEYEKTLSSSALDQTNYIAYKMFVLEKIVLKKYIKENGLNEKYEMMDADSIEDSFAHYADPRNK